jgi:hypothetical protein
LQTLDIRKLCEVPGAVLAALSRRQHHTAPRFMTKSLFDEYNKPILQIQNNALIYSVSPRDIELVGKRLRVRERARSFLLDVVFNPPSTITIERARFMLNGVEILVRPDHVLILNGPTLIRGSQAEGAQFGFVLGNQDVLGSDMVRIRDLNRYLGDRSEVLAWARESLGR